MLAKLAKLWGAELDVISESKPPSLYAELRRVRAAADDFREARKLDKDKGLGGSWYARVAWLFINRRLTAMGFDNVSFESAQARRAPRDSVEQTAANWIESAGPVRLRSSSTAVPAMVGKPADLKKRAADTRRRIYDAMRELPGAASAR